MAHHKPQLDALRAFAVLTVWFVHFWPGLLPVGNGVRFFFTLSGFLITGILLDRKSHIENAPDLGGRIFVLRQFYARRLIRILPAYYALILALAYISVPSSLKDSLWFHASFTSNFWMAFNGSWEP